MTSEQPRADSDSPEYGRTTEEHLLVSPGEVGQIQEATRRSEEGDNDEKRNRRLQESEDQSTMRCILLDNLDKGTASES